MRFNLQAFKASFRPGTPDESRDSMAELVAKCGHSDRYESIEREFHEDLTEVHARTLHLTEGR